MSDTRLESVLNRCGLTETESRIVQDMLVRGETTAGSLARRVNFKRATVYSALSQLETRGLIVRRKQGAVGRFALPPHRQLINLVRSIWERSRQEAELATNVLADILKEYPEGTVKRIGGYEIVSYESRKKTEEFFISILTRGNYDSLYDISEFSSGRWRKLMLHVLKVTAISKPPIRELILKTEDTSWYTRQIRNPNHQVKILPSRRRFTSDFTVTNDSVILNTYETGAEISLQIRHPGYVDMMRRIFNSLWEGNPIF